MKKEITCIVCPKGCLVTIDDANLEDISGYSCPKGMDYAKNELLHPVRTFVCVQNLFSLSVSSAGMTKSKSRPYFLCFFCKRSVIIKFISR